jgi:hypothetical protein
MHGFAECDCRTPPGGLNQPAQAGFVHVAGGFNRPAAGAQSHAAQP